jgi:hypothetical protein
MRFRKSIPLPWSFRTNPVAASAFFMLNRNCMRRKTGGVAGGVNPANIVRSTPQTTPLIRRRQARPEAPQNVNREICKGSRMPWRKWNVNWPRKTVFHGAGKREGIRCVHPVQVYLDLKNSGMKFMD